MFKKTVISHCFLNKGLERQAHGTFTFQYPFVFLTILKQSTGFGLMIEKLIIYYIAYSFQDHYKMTHGFDIFFSIFQKLSVTNKQLFL